ncbi:MAG: HupE/UreJ family protein [Rhizobiales bacterium]|nr:HupE/UreJ family protein [Hyphomicrobiales bacterium]
MLRTIALSTILFGALFTPAFAHIGLHDQGGLAHGFMHPIGGLDHVMAMVAVGMLAAHLGGRALWLVPAAFVGMMIVGGVLGFMGAPLPFVEQGIGLSVVVLGVLVALGVGMPTILAMTVVGLFAVFHGHAHGTELPAGSAPAAFAAGFIAATALLHAAGIGLGIAIQRIAVRSRVWTTRIIGAVMALTGVSLFVQ